MLLQCSSIIQSQLTTLFSRLTICRPKLQLLFFKGVLRVTGMARVCKRMGLAGELASAVAVCSSTFQPQAATAAATTRRAPTL